MIDFKNPAEAEKAINDWADAYEQTLATLTLRIATDRCMYEGCQWLSRRRPFELDSRLNRRYTNWEPESNNLVATVNRMVPQIRECEAATYPTRIEVDAAPPDRDMGIEAAERVRVLEAIVNSGIDASGYLQAAIEANFQRCVDGDYGIGLRIKVGKRQMRGSMGAYEEEDCVLSAFSFDATNLILDPGNKNRDLRNHEYVVYHDVWTIDAINRYFGMKLDPDDCKTVGELRQLQMYMNRVSNNRLYEDLPVYSKTKGAFVYQIHIKDDSGRFSRMYIGVKVPPRSGEAQFKWVNFDDPISPFGGETQLPLVLLHGAKRPGSMWSQSDAFLMKDDQDRVNLLNTFTFRILQKTAGAKWRVSRGSMKDIDDFQNQFNNMIYGPIMYNEGTRDYPHPPPELITQPSPPPFLQELVAVYEDQMRRQVHREEITSGGYKTHTTNQTYQTARESANQVLDIRVREDMMAHETLLETMLGTYVRLAQEGSPSTLAFMRRAGFDAGDFAQVSMADWRYPACSLRLRESSIRNQSREQKKEDLWRAVEQRVLTPQKLRLALAELDVPLDETDKAMKNAATKAAMRVLLGEEWVPTMLGEYADMFLGEFRRARWDRRAELDPTARERLDRAIVSQLHFNQIELGMMQPPQPEQPAAAGQEQVSQMPEEVNIADLITSLNSGGGGQATQPAAA